MKFICQNHIFHCLNIFFAFVCFSNPTSPPRSFIGLVPCVPSYTLISPVFKGVTRGMSFKHTSPPLSYPWYMQVRPGAQSRPIIWETWVQVPRSGVPRVKISDSILRPLNFENCHRNGHFFTSFIQFDSKMFIQSQIIEYKMQSFKIRDWKDKFTLKISGREQCSLVKSWVLESHFKLNM